jgi:hypothetical protein
MFINIVHATVWIIISTFNIINMYLKLMMQCSSGQLWPCIK